jgi:hypothetical protein
MMVSISPTVVAARSSVISKGDAKRAKRRWTSSQASASPISRGFLKTNVEAAGETGGVDRLP